MESGRALIHSLRASEAQCLNYAAKNLGSPDLLLSEWGRAAHPVDDLYVAVWRRRGIMERAIAGRQQAMRLNAAAGSNTNLQQYLAGRHTLASLLLAPTDGNPEQLATQRERIEQLSEAKERLARLGGACPGR